MFLTLLILLSTLILKHLLSLCDCKVIYFFSFCNYIFTKKLQFIDILLLFDTFCYFPILFRFFYPTPYHSFPLFLYRMSIHAVRQIS